MNILCNLRWRSACEENNWGNVCFRITNSFIEIYTVHSIIFMWIQHNEKAKNNKKIKIIITQLPNNFYWHGLCSISPLTYYSSIYWSYHILMILQKLVEKISISPPSLESPLFFNDDSDNNIIITSSSLILLICELHERHRVWMKRLGT